MMICSRWGYKYIYKGEGGLPCGGGWGSWVRDMYREGGI
jgi:hypothetical protein